MMRQGVMSVSLALATLCTATGARAQTPPMIGQLGRCKLANSATITDCRIAYRTFGVKNSQGSNAILVPTWLAGKSEEWIALLGPGRLIDTTRYYVVVVDALGNGNSSSPSTIVGSFPQIAIEDMVQSQYRLAREVLGLSHLHAIVGVSMGGIQAFEWAVAHPDFSDRFVSIVGTPRAPRHERAWLGTIVRLIDAGERYRIPMDSVWRMLAGILVMVNETQEAVNQTPPEHADSLLAVIASSLGKSVNLKDFAAQTRAILAYNAGHGPEAGPAPVPARLAGRFLAINSPDDRTVSAQPAFAFARSTGADTLVVRSLCGHNVFRCDAAAIGMAIEAFLAK